MGFWASQGGIFGAITGGAYVGVIAPSVLSTTQFISSVMAGFAAGGISGGNVQSALQGAFSAGLFFGVGTLGDFAQNSGLTGFGDGGVGRVALHAAAGCATGAAAGGSCGRGAASAGFAEAIGGNFGGAVGGGNAGQLVFRAVVGGVASMLGGGKFANGAMTGAFGYLFNCLGGHQCGRNSASDDERLNAFSMVDANGAPIGGNPVGNQAIGLVAGGAVALAGGAIGLTFVGTTAAGDTLVYMAVEGGVVRYIGITKDFISRAAAHLAEKGIQIERIEGLSNLARAEARAVEQVLIETFGLAKNGGSLLNKINSIAQTNPIYSNAITRGTELLKSIKFPGF